MALSLPFPRAEHISARLPKAIVNRAAPRTEGERAPRSPGARCGIRGERTRRHGARLRSNARPRADCIWPPQWSREMVLLKVLFPVPAVASCGRCEGARSIGVARRVAQCAPRRCPRGLLASAPPARPPRAARRDLERSLGGARRCAQHARTEATRLCGPRGFPVPEHAHPIPQARPSPDHRVSGRATRGAGCLRCTRCARRGIALNL
jgi:hypothetical protein